MVVKIPISMWEKILNIPTYPWANRVINTLDQFMSITFLKDSSYPQRNLDCSKTAE